MTEPSIPAAPPGLVPAPRSPRHDVVAGLDVAVRRRRSDTVVRVVGELDAATAPGLVAVLDAELTASAARTVWCDLGDVTFVAAAGLTALETALRLAGERGTALHLVGRARPLLRVLSLTGAPLVVHPGSVLSAEPVDSTS